MTGSKHRTVLVVEDQKPMADIWRRRLSQLGYDVEISPDGQDAIDRMGTVHFDAVLLDLNLPKRHGFDVLTERTHSMNKDTPTYVVTGTFNEEDLTKAKQLGANDAFLKYRSSPADIIKTVEAALA